MALTWDLTDIEDNENLCWIETGEKDDNGELKLGRDGKPEARMNPVTEALIFNCMFVGLRGITAENVGVYAARTALNQKLHGDLLIGPDGPEPIKTEDVHAHIGLRCNVSDESDTVWIKRQVTEDYKRECKRLQREYVESQKVEAEA